MSIRVVPEGYNQELARQAPNVHVQSGADGEEWALCAMADLELLRRFVQGEYFDAPSKTWSPQNGVRFGTDGRGIYICRDHSKRYFGLPENLLPGIPADACVHAKQHSRASDSHDMRENVLRGIFKTLDTNNSGSLDVEELGVMLRRLAPRIRKDEVQELFEKMDRDHNGGVDYQEFLTWIRNRAPEKIKKELGYATGSDRDAVLACFRAMDVNGDGSITRGELAQALSQSCPGMKRKDFESLFQHLDGDHSKVVDYTEFVDFLFGS